LFTNWYKIQGLLKSDTNNGYLLEDQCTFIIMCRLILDRVRNISDKVVQKIKTHILYSRFFFFFFENRAVYGIMWMDITQPYGSQMTKYRTCTFHAGKLRLQTQTHNMYVILTGFHCYSGYTKAPKCYVTCTLPALLQLKYSGI
jgi:hypothetical protein